MKKYEGCVKGILEQLLKYKEMTLEILNTVCTEEERTQLLPTAEIFREVIIEFLTAGTIDIGALQNEQSDYLMDASDGFVLNEDVTWSDGRPGIPENRKDVYFPDGRQCACVL